MKNSATHGPVARFGDFEVYFRTGDVRKHGHRIRLQEKPYQILALLLERAGEIVTREELRQRLWPADTFVDFDANLNTSLNRLRQALGDTANEQVFIKTIPRQGYRFVAPVTRFEDADTVPTPPASPVAPSVAHQGAANPPAQPASRFFHAFRPALIAVIFVAIVVGALLYFRWVRASALAERGPHRVTILVTPFENLSGDANEDYLSDGLTDEMITRLGEIAPGHLSVIARSSAMQYKGAHKTIEQITREQHVDYILEGSFRRQGDQVRITAQLFDARDRGSLWTEAYERNAGDLLAIQREVADRIAHSLPVEISSPGGRPAAEPNPVKPEAYDDYLKGLFELNKRTPDDLQRSIEYFRLSSEKDTQFAPAYAALAFSYNVAAGWAFLSPQEAYPKARVAAQKALAIDDTLADSHLAYGEVLHEYDWDWAGSQKEYQRALELNPSSAVGHKLYAEYLTHAGRYEEALDEIRKARELDPASLVTNSFVCFVYMHGREYDRAIKTCREVVEMEPRFMPAHDWLADAYVFSGRYEEAIAEFKKAMELSNSANYFLTSLAMTYGLEGKKEEARKILGELKLRGTQTYVSPFGLADVYIGLGDKEQSLAMLTQAMKEHSADLVFLATAPEFDSLHDDARFQAMITRIGFPESAAKIPSPLKPDAARPSSGR
jgi:TolB-like protein/DNA-binding winged helix-turn-helix (wHTH) protein/Tfp pilus assembly protein PilF